MVELIELIIAAAIIGLFVAIIVLFAQFTIANIGPILICAAVGTALYFLLKPIDNKSQPSTTKTAPARQSTPRAKNKNWGVAWAVLGWLVFWTYVTMLLSLGKDWPLAIKILVILSPHIIAASIIIYKRLKLIHGAKNKWRELMRMIIYAAKICGYILFIVLMATAAISLIVLLANNQS